VQDLKILHGNWQHLRLYDCSRHAEIVLEAIKKESLNFKVMLGADIKAEMSNPGCPWYAEYTKKGLYYNRHSNDDEIGRMIELANRYPETVQSVSVGNEATVDWTDHMISVERLVEFVGRIKARIKQPVTFCENYVPWTQKLEPLAQELDFISLHTYPVWEYHTVETAIDYTRQNYYEVLLHYPDKPVVITEAGWATKSNGRGIEPWNASQEFQAQYYSQIMDWSYENRILTYVFEAFDEPWKGSGDPLDPEKHWGVFTVDRKPKAVMQELYSHLHQ
jgi:exo-beta-1,3-glucanase (GH17 family)